MKYLVLILAFLYTSPVIAGTSVTIGNTGSGTVVRASANAIVISDSDGNLFGTDCKIPEVAPGVHTSISCPGAPTLPTSLILNEREDAAGANYVAFTLQPTNLSTSRTVKADSSGIFSFERHFITAQIPTASTATWIEPTSLGSLVGVYCRSSGAESIVDTTIQRNTVGGVSNDSTNSNNYSTSAGHTTEILATSSLSLTGGTEAIGGWAILTLAGASSLTDCLIEYRDEE